MKDIHWAILENIATLAAIASIIIGVYAFGGGGYGFWALVLMINLNTGIRLKSQGPAYFPGERQEQHSN